MRKVLVTTTFFVVFLASTSFAFAQTPTPGRTPKGLEIRDEVRTTKLEREASHEERFCELRKNKIESYFIRMVKRLEALTKRLQKLIDRIESRIDKIEAGNEGINLTGPKADLADAKTKLADAKTKLDSLKGDIDTFLTCEDPKEDFKTVRGKVSEIKKDLREVHRILVHIIGNIKGLRVGQGSP